MAKTIVNRKIVGILRGVTPPEVVDISEALIAAGVTIIEVPLNSPDAFSSIEKLVINCSDRALIGAGTVLRTHQVAQLADIGAKIIVSPNTNLDVIQKTKKLGLLSYPGVQTATECFAAIDAGADALKIFPAGTLGTSGISALRAVLPQDMPVLAVGGIELGQLRTWANAGVSGFGIGSLFYKPGQTPADINATATAFVTEFDNIEWRTGS